MVGAAPRNSTRTRRGRTNGSSQKSRANATRNTSSSTPRNNPSRSKSNGPRTINAFFLFMNSIRLQSRTSRFQCTLQRLFTKKVGDCWRQMSEQDRLRWHQEAEKLKRERGGSSYIGEYTLGAEDSITSCETKKEIEDEYVFVNYTPGEKTFKGGIVKNKNNNKQNVATKSTDRSAGEGHVNNLVDGSPVNYNSATTTGPVTLDSFPAPTPVIVTVLGQVIQGGDYNPIDTYCYYPTPTLPETLFLQQYQVSQFSGQAWLMADNYDHPNDINTNKTV
ncbi:998_t:CDS:1 [Paraglomus brasilianum]|uniref:998_t:CDS:1 n=1 Tax=Paraglomus brasilianum TaxID=144538 RepID=A0A9N8VF99_9GLOM|nr:998_t:CDS:1 [Paraglomus brasilianum]